MKVGDLVTHLFDGTSSYGVIVKVDRDNRTLVRVQWISDLANGSCSGVHSTRHLVLVAEA
jgi:predicted RNA-binding protein with RPS1 domain